MRDLISRQAAIDALGEEPMVWTDNDYAVGQKNQWQLDRLAIETVPSAQVWIPVSERLPERGDRVLTCSGDIMEIQELSFGGAWENDGGDIQEFEAVSAWMPLPDPYKEAEA